MDQTKYGNALDFDVDLHSIYAAYLGLFESSNTEWWEKSWGGYFTTFNDFLGFGWEVMVIVDTRTGRSHIAVRADQIALFAKMIRTRFGESLPKDPPTTMPLSPVATKSLSLRRLITISDLTAYKKLALTLPAAELSYLRTRAKHGDVEIAEQLFYAGGSSSERDRGGSGVRDNGVGYTWACLRTIWWEKGGAPHGVIPGSGRTPGKTKGLILEAGLAVLRCANLRAVNVWPPTPEENYRKLHVIADEWVDKRANLSPPNHPRAYGFGTSRYVAEKDVEKIIDSNLAAIASHDNENSANTLILLSVGEPEAIPVPTSSTLPNNILHIDLLALEHNLLRRAQDQGVPGTPNRRTPLGSLSTLLQTLQIPVPQSTPLGNAGNEAYYTLLAFQKLMMAETRLPSALFENYYPFPAPYPVSIPMQSRDSSMSSRRQSGMPMIQDTHRRASEASRTRPVSLADEHGVPKRAPLPRSQTVFWDDAEYADDTPRRRRQSTFKDDRGRPGPSPVMPPSALKSSMRNSNSRSISFERPRAPLDSQASLPLRGSNTALNTRDGSGSSTKLSSSEDSKVTTPGAVAAELPPVTKEKKIKSEKSIKNLAGTLARFWVG